VGEKVNLIFALGKTSNKKKIPKLRVTTVDLKDSEQKV